VLLVTVMPAGSLRKHGLYYPYFHVRNNRWLKAAALYWPAIVRLVPEGYVTDDSDTVRALEDEGFLVRQPPGESVEAVAPLFLDLVQRHGEDLRQRFPIIMDVEPQRLLLQRTGQLRWAGLHITQMTGEVDEALCDAGLCTGRATDELWSWTRDTFGRAIPGSHKWVVMHPELVAAYTSVLAEHFADANLLRPTTDVAGAHAVVNNWTTERLAEVLLQPSNDGPWMPWADDWQPFDYAWTPQRRLARMFRGRLRQRQTPTLGELPEVLGFLALNLVVPADLDAVPVLKIIEIRRRYGEEFRAFGAAVEQAAADLAELITVSDARALKRYLVGEVANRFAQPTRDLQHRLRDLKIDAATMAVNVKTELPAGAALAGGAWLTGHPVVASTSAAALGLLAVRRGVRQQRDAARQAVPTASYLLHVRQDLDARSLLERALNRIRLIANAD
jgi:hypothetical protein